VPKDLSLKILRYAQNDNNTVILRRNVPKDFSLKILRYAQNDSATLRMTGFLTLNRFFLSFTYAL
jgi:hypothetical protein